MTKATGKPIGRPPINSCAICDHPRRREIETRLMDGGAGNTMTALYKEFKVKAGQILRHKEQHMAETAQEIVRMCNEEYDKKMIETGVAKKILSIEVLDAFIEKYKDLLGEVSAKDVLQAIKLKEDLLGHIVQKQEVKLSWLNEIPDEE